MDTDADQRDAQRPPGFDRRRAGLDRRSRQWAVETPTLTVTVTLTAAFMATLTVGTHHLFLTAISQRGLSDYREARIEVTP